MIPPIRIEDHLKGSRGLENDREAREPISAHRGMTLVLSKRGKAIRTIRHPVDAPRRSEK